MTAIRSHRRLAGLLLAFLIGAAFGLIADLLGLNETRLAVGWALTIIASVLVIAPWALVRRPVSHAAIDFGPGPAFQLRMLWRAEDLIQVSQSGIAESPHRPSYSSEVRRDSPPEIAGSWS